MLCYRPSGCTEAGVVAGERAEISCSSLGQQGWAGGGGRGGEGAMHVTLGKGRAHVGTITKLDRLIYCS